MKNKQKEKIKKIDDGKLLRQAVKLSNATGGLYSVRRKFDRKIIEKINEIIGNLNEK